MPELDITIGTRNFAVACQEGEEQYLVTAAEMLDAEAQTLISQIGRLPENRMLLMAGLMLADKTAGLEDKLAAAEARVAELEGRIKADASKPAPEPERVEVAVMPEGVMETMAELAARAEAVADEVEEKARA
ncbi:cell division protein ZapA [Roseivivax halotolerans]|jgi:cell division protein ZapA|uniref:Cell division protein ZapA n=1 Tax=Roseivivax halotolerans TaxID=93684 RepID=A0A1I5ZEN4_9RHOB|nr:MULTISPECIES: cell division protein ZapA [Roseivivax]QFT63214.1 Cell division protein ZapA [Roseivivax sp. THAF30]SFQ54587.1 cell division protein ZapA [Roseivivax halotolerans]